MNRGLLVPDVPFALHALEHHNYYRISAYRFPLSEPGSPDQFLSGSSFNDLWSLYHFDRTLRQFVLEAIQRLEVSVRSKWAYVLGHTYGSQAYEDPSIFRTPQQHTWLLAKLDQELSRSDEVFVGHYKEKYEMERPPIWAACEVMSFGLLSRFYANLRRNRDRKAIARTYDLSADTLKSLLEHSTYIRNLCAHHCRLWNRRFTVTVQYPKTSPSDVIASLNPDAPRQVYNTLVVLIYVVRLIEPSSTWPQRLCEQLRLQLDPKFITLMGFPLRWEKLPMWAELTEAT